MPTGQLDEGEEESEVMREARGERGEGEKKLEETRGWDAAEEKL